MPTFKKNTLLLFLLCVTNYYSLLAQNTNNLLDNANRLFELKQYPKAIQAFNDILKNSYKNLSRDAQLSVLLNLAYSYKQNKGELNAEKIYRQAFSNFPKLISKDAKAHINFAQVLANNGKYQEAQEYLMRSESIQSTKNQNIASNQEQLLPTNNIDNSSLSNTTFYKLEYLELNTSGPEFSPIYYKDGIVFCSSKESSTTIMNDKGGFLDLFYLDDLKKVQQYEAPNNDKRKKKGANKKSLGDDYYSRKTSNDTKTLNYFSGDENNETTNTITTESFSKTLNSKFHEGPATFNHDFSKIIFTRNNSTGNRKAFSEDNVSKLKLFSADYSNNDWQEPTELPFNNSEYSTAHPAWSKDEKTLYFASDRPGGFGGMDIWSVAYNDGQWDTPKNLGKNINSSENEVFPFVDEHGTLYFSSNGQGGEGGLDIFFAEINAGQSITKAINLGTPFNSPFDDFGFICDEKRQTGYFSSNRKSGDDDDIYRFSIDNNTADCHEVMIIVIDENTQKAITNASVIISSLNNRLESKKTDLSGNVTFCTTQNTDYSFKIEKDGFIIKTIGYSTKGESNKELTKLEVALKKQEQIEYQISATASNPSKSKKTNPTNLKNKSILTGFVKSEIDQKPMEGVLVSFINVCDKSTQQMTTGADGSYTFYMNEDCDYTIEVSKSGYSKNFNKIKKVQRGNNKVISQDLSLFKEGDLITMNNIYYDSGSADLRKDALRELNKLAVTLQKTPTMVIELGSHTDSRGDAQVNLNLSTKRAQAAVDYIVSKGINRNRILAKGYGESELANSCADGVSCTEIEHQQNRRTTVKIIKIK